MTPHHPGVRGWSGDVAGEIRGAGRPGCHDYTALGRTGEVRASRRTASEGVGGGRQVEAEHPVRLDLDLSPLARRADDLHGSAQGLCFSWGRSTDPEEPSRKGARRGGRIARRARGRPDGQGQRSSQQEPSVRRGSSPHRGLDVDPTGGVPGGASPTCRSVPQSRTPAGKGEAGPVGTDQCEHPRGTDLLHPEPAVWDGR
jgi:hypothetical protein